MKFGEMVLPAIVTVAASTDFHGGATLVSSLRTVAPGSSFEVAVKIDLDPGWHTYWRNPGDAGIPPTISWRLPAGWKAGPIQWPVPHKLVAPEVVSFGYEREALLLVKLTAPKSARPSTRVSLAAKVEWLVCQDGCIPATASVRDELKVSNRNRTDPVWSSRINQALMKLPVPSKTGSFSATLSGKNIVLLFQDKRAPKPSSVTFYPSDMVVEPSAPQTFSLSGSNPTLTLTLSQFAPSAVHRLRGLLVSQRGAATTSQTIDIPLWRTNL
jgi:DsbC/DsbD-like thiol-disulfide interchange protein